MVLIGIMYCDDIGMRKPGTEPGLQIEAFNKIAISGKPGRENLHSYFPVKVLLVRLIDTSHPPLANGGQDLVVSKRHTVQIVLLHDIVGAKMLCQSCALSPRHRVARYYVTLMPTY